jgi:hypothetical protein
MNRKYSKVFKANTVAAAVAAVLGGTAGMPADASQYRFTFTGWFTMLGPTGDIVLNSDSSACPASMQNPPGGSCVRTTMVGEINYCDALPCEMGFAAGEGTITVTPFSFFGGGAASATNVAFESVGDGKGGAGDLLLGNMGFDWNGTFGIPVSTVWNANGLLGCLGAGLDVGDTCNNVGVLAASDSTVAGFEIGQIPLAMTVINTTTIPGTTLNSNPSGTTPLFGFNSTIGGSPMVTAPFQGFNANFDFETLLLIEKDGVTLGGAPVASTLTPAAGATNVQFSTNVIVIFDRPVDATTVAATGGFTLRDSAGNNIPGTVTPATGSATQFTFAPSDDNPDPAFNGLDFLDTYTATLAATIKNASSADTLGSPVNWSFTVAQRPPIQVCTGTVSPYTSVGNGAPNGDSNFTMLTSIAGNNPNAVEDGTNDVSYSLDLNLNTTVNGTTGLLTNEIASPTPYKGFVWDAHHIRLFGQGTWQIDTTCTTAQLEAGVSACNNPLQTSPTVQTQRFITFTVGPGQIGAHMLFDWNGILNIDVVNVWNQDDIYDVSPDGNRNNLHVRATYGGPAGNEADPQGTWEYASSDVIVGGITDGGNGAPMVDGPFIGFNANFNLGPQSTCTPAPPPVTSAPANSLSKGFFGCSLTDGNVNPWQRADLGLLAGFLGALAFWRRRNRTNA